MSHIYLVTNLINGKKYIGYTSLTVIERFNRHITEANYLKEKDQSIFHQALLKYGRSNFKIENVYTFDENLEDWRELEKKYIKLFNTIRPNGYNILEGGDKPPVKYGNNNIKTKYPDELLPQLYNMLKDPSISYEKIANETGLSIGYLYLVNQGKYRKNPNLSYPLREFDTFELRALGIIEILANDKTLSNKKIANMFGIRPNEVASINHGKKYKKLWNGEFPIRKELVPDDYEEKQELAKKVLLYKKEHPNLSYAQIQKNLNIKRGVFDKINQNIYPYNVN